MSSKVAFIISNGDLRRVDEPIVTANSRGLMYGDGCFETFCAYDGAFFKPGDHLNRLQEGLEYLGIDFPEDLQGDSLKPLLDSLLQKNKLSTGKTIVRVQVWRKESRGYATDSSNSDYMITASSYSAPRKLYTLATISTRRIPSSALSAKFKFTNGLNYITAANEARTKGADDALMQTIDGAISETTVANIFWIRGDNVFTPSVDCDILPGITREVTIDLLQSQIGTTVQEGEFTIEDVKKADAAWICNSVKEIVAVAQIDDTMFDTDNAVIKKLQAAFSSFVNNQLSKSL